MNIENWPIEKLKEYANNPRKNDHAVEAVALAISKYGFRVPILARSSGDIIDGHLRYKAAKHAGLCEVPVLLADDLSEDEVKAFRISVNKVAELAQWDIKLLQQELLELQEVDYDLSTLGFSEVDLDGYLHGATGKNNPDAIPEVKEPVAKTGDLWTLGKHRLYVGDSRKQDSYDRLLSGRTVDLVWSDPPYNVDYHGKAGKIKNDCMSESEFSGLLRDFYTNAFSCLKPGGPVYIAHADGQPGNIFRKEFLQAGFYFSTCLIWKKNQSTLGRSDYHYQHEPILYGWKPGKAHCWYGGRKRKGVMEFGDQPLFIQTGPDIYQIHLDNETLIVSGKDIAVESVRPTILSFDKPSVSALHPTMKPVALVEHCLINSSSVGDTVLDGFGGSGTTMIACEMRNRSAMIIEIDEHFADVIICRWQEFTGLSAVLGDGRTYEDVKRDRA
jgi:DNA modification methylase